MMFEEGGERRSCRLRYPIAGLDQLTAILRVGENKYVARLSMKLITNG